MHARLKGGGFAAFVILAGLVPAAPSQADPLLLVDIQGFIPTLTVTQTTQGVEGGTAQPLVTTTQTFTNVPFSAQFTFDGAKWALAQNTGGPTFPLYQFSETDPGGGQTTPTGDGIETEEWMRGEVTLGLGGGVTLALDRDFVYDRPADAISAPGFGGQNHIQYLEGSETVPVLGSDFSDAFGMSTSGGFAYFLPVAPPVGEVASRGQSWFFSLLIVQGYDLQAQYHDLFGPGAPFAFLWEDPTPTDCSTAFPVECQPQFSFGHFQFFDATGTIASPTLFEVRTTQYDGDLLFTRVSVTPAVPEPATLVTALTGLIALGLKRRRRT